MGLNGSDFKKEHYFFLSPLNLFVTQFLSKVMDKDSSLKQ